MVDDVLAGDALPQPIVDLVATVGALNQDMLRDAAQIPHERHDAYLLAQRYYDGNQETKLTDRAKEFLENSGLEYNENFCETVVDALAARLRVTGVTSEDDDFAAYVWGVLWDRNRLDAHQGMFHTETLKKGDGYLIVDWDAAGGYPCVKFNAPERCQIAYEDGEKLWAAKTWDTSTVGPLNPKGRAIVRMNVYRPDRIEKYFRLSKDAEGDWSIWVDEGDASWPIDWTFDGVPIGIPVFHLANKPGAGKFGRAEHRGTIPQQDALNKKLIDLALVEDTLGHPQRYIAGDDATNQLTATPGSVWRTPNENSVFGQFPAADLTGLLQSIEAQLFRIAARSQTPAHMVVVSGGAPSGESLKTAEAGLVSKGDDRSSTWGEEYIGVFRMMATLGALHGQGEYKPPLDAAAIRDVKLNVQWADRRTRNELEHLQTLAAMKDLGVSEETVLGMIPGVDAADEIAKKEVARQTLGEQLLNAMDAGGQVVPGQGRPVPPPTPPRPPAVPPS